MRRGITYTFYLVIVLMLIALPSLVRWLRFNSLNNPEPSEPPLYEPTGLAEFVTTPEATEFIDEPEAGEGQVLLDQAHENRFDLQEIGYLDGRLSARGYELVSYEGGELANALRPVSAFVVIAPMEAFTPAEIQAVTDFVDRGGHLFMAGDPTRFTLAFEDDAEDLTPYGYRVESDQIPLNSLANKFDLNYNGDYVYNTVENEGNYRNIIIGDDGGFEPDQLTIGLDKLAFYGSHSIQADNESLALLSADDNTWSSATDRPGGLSLAALAHAGQVLAVGDIDFLTEPYYTVFDNSRFIAQIADFLAEEDRNRTLADFPYFFGDHIDLIYTGDPELGPDTFDEIIAWQAAFRDTGRTLALTDESITSNDTLFIGLYNQAEDVDVYLAAEDISLLIDPPIEQADEQSSEAGDEIGVDDASDTEDDGADSDADDQEEPVTRIINSDLGSVHMAGTALILLTEDMGRPKLVVLAASADGLENTTERLIALMPAGAEGTLADCLLQGNLALCPTDIIDEEVEAELFSGSAADEPAESDAKEGDGEEEEVDSSGGEEAEESDEDSTEDGEEAIVPDTDLQGSIQLDETIEATLESNQAHAWTFSDGPAVVNITLIPVEPVDGILELYGPDGGLLGAADSDFTAGEESLEFAEIPDDQVYTIVVRDFFEEGGDYSLSVISVTPEDLDAVEQGILPEDEPVDGTLENGEVHSWLFSIDAPATVDITLSPDPELDALLVLFDPDFRLIKISDDGFDGDEERLEALSLDDPGEYTVVVGGYSFGGSSYSLLLELAQ